MPTSSAWRAPRPADVKALFASISETEGRLDILINNAGTEGLGVAPPQLWSDAHIDTLVDTNLKGVFVSVQQALPLLLARGGVVLNVASFVGTVIPLADAMLYGATKAAVISLTRATAAGYGEQDVRAYALCPWVTDTAMVDRLTGGAADAKARFAGSLNPSGRLAQPEELAEVALRMVTDSQAFANGAAILVDAGAVMSRLVPSTVEPSQAEHEATV